MAFKTTKRATVSLDSPEAMYKDIRPRKIEGLLSHQADVLREYTRVALEEPDVALQLPTGSGKTLVGVVLAEWRRQKFDERVVYVCPTRQLVNQVAKYANEEYGIKVHGFTGKQKAYDPKAKGEWQSGEAIAVTTYSGLFNANPFFDAPHVIVVDDAHAVEGYIAEHWSVKVERYNSAHKALFGAMASCLRPAIEVTEFARLVSEPKTLWEQTWVDMVPTPAFHALIPAITAVLDEHIGELELRYSWRLIRDHLTACQLYLGSSEIVIRPLLPPTNTHAPFAVAKQRVYMSATLGEGGELERLMGRKKITRLPIPEGWDKQGIGRRFFMFPGRSLQADEQESVLMDLMRDAKRSLVLVPNDKMAGQFRSVIQEKLKFTTFGAAEIEQSKEPFTSSQKAVAVIANRYDGIDFPKDDCRLLIVAGLPRATNLQERFLISRMGAMALLNDRIRTRIVQAFGRCTRSATDYSAVIIVGEELPTYLMKKEGREYLHPELQAEIRFGLEQSTEQSRAGFRENLKLFLGQGPEWAKANGEIVALREGSNQKKLPAMENLRAAAPLEVEYVYAMWSRDYVSALEKCRAILGDLTAPELKGYRALWSYLAGCAAWLASKAGATTLENQVGQYFEQAAKSSSGITWLNRLAMLRPEATVSTPSAQTASLLERMESVLESLGTMHDWAYAKEEKEILEGLSSSDAAPFERAHERLGRLLGYDAGNHNSTGAPDPWWVVDSHLCLVFEDHSDGKADTSLGVNKARQVATHPNWIRSNLSLAKDAEIVSVLISPVKKADKDALAHLKGVSYWNLEEFQAWAHHALRVVRKLRTTFQGAGDLVWRAEAAAILAAERMDPAGLIQDLKKQKADELLTP